MYVDITKWSFRKKPLNFFISRCILYMYTLTALAWWEVCDKACWRLLYEYWEEKSFICIKRLHCKQEVVFFFTYEHIYVNRRNILRQGQWTSVTKHFDFFLCCFSVVFQMISWACIIHIFPRLCYYVCFLKCLQMSKDPRFSLLCLHAYYIFLLSLVLALLTFSIDSESLEPCRGKC